MPAAPPPQLAAVTRAASRVPVDIRGLASDLAIRIEFADLGPRVSACLRREAPGWRLQVPAGHDEIRLRFTLADAIAQTLLHDTLLGDAATIDDDYLSPDLPEEAARQARDYAEDLLMPWQAFEEAWKAEGSLAAATRFGVAPIIATHYHARVSGAAARARQELLFDGPPATEAERLLGLSITVLSQARRALVAAGRRDADGGATGTTETIEAIDALFRDFAPWATDRLKRGQAARTSEASAAPSTAAGPVSKR